MMSTRPKFRFAPSPNGHLHLGHARSALLNRDMARAAGGAFLIRIEDIDIIRCTPAFETAILEDLSRLGLRSDEPIRRQSEHFAAYGEALTHLKELGLVYPSFLSRAEIKAAVARLQADGRDWPRDPDGVPHYPGNERALDPAVAKARIAAGEQVTWRLNMRRALALLDEMEPLSWQESGDRAPGHDDDRVLGGGRAFRTVAAEPARWGDVILARAEIPTSYHLAVVVDDAVQGITDVVRGADLYHATSVHRLLQALLGLAAPRYHHHALVRDADGRKLSKSDGDYGLGTLLDQGLGIDHIRKLAGL